VFNKTIFEIMAVAAVIATPALAADMSVKAVQRAPAPIATTWTGCYIGANVGGGWADTKFTEAALSVLPGASDGGHTASGWHGGGQVGCDYQFTTNWVIGIRGMWDGANLTGSNRSPDIPALGDFTLHTKVSSVASLVGEVGYLFTPTTKFYGKAGIGWVRDKFTCNGPACQLPNPYIVDETRRGFDLGVGLAWMFAPNWDLFVEYDHMWLGSKTVLFNANNLPFFETIKQDLNQVIAGVDYRFTWGR
jgi:outer membrane immunogenic protein